MGYIVWLSALGYFVDLYDLLLFSIVRVSSLKSIGVPDDQLLSTGVLLINLQMTGLLLGGWFFGILGDRYGRKSILLGSILLYSVANFLNAFVQDVSMYGVLRFIAGFGLAGELGAAVTLVAESLPTSKRTYGAMMIALVGMLGAVTAGFFAEWFDWRTCYAIGGAMGLLLLFGRKKVFESPLFLNQRMAQKKTHFLQQTAKIFFSSDKLKTYLLCVAVGLPLWFTSGLLITFAPEFCKELGVVGEVKVGRGILICYGAATLGDLLAGLSSTWFKSRKKTIALFMFATLCASCAFLFSRGLTANQVYLLFAIMGLAGGYWSMYVLYAAEQFGTNLRATVTVSMPNMVRGAVVLMTTAFQSLTPAFGVIPAAHIVGATVIFLAYVSLVFLKETYSKDLDFAE